MGLEEQKEEREILESIYPEEITGQSTPKPHNIWTIALTSWPQTCQKQNSE